MIILIGPATNSNCHRDQILVIFTKSFGNFYQKLVTMTNSNCYRDQIDNYYQELVTRPIPIQLSSRWNFGNFYQKLVMQPIPIVIVKLPKFLVKITKITMTIRIVSVTKIFGKNYQNLVMMTIGIGRMTNFW